MSLLSVQCRTPTWTRQHLTVRLSKLEIMEAGRRKLLYPTDYPQEATALALAMYYPSVRLGAIMADPYYFYATLPNGALDIYCYTGRQYTSINAA